MADTGGRPKMVPVTDAAEQIGVDPRTLRAAGQRREIPVRRIGTRYFLPAAWLDSITSWPPEGSAA